MAIASRWRYRAARIRSRCSKRLLLLAKRAPIEFSVCAFTVEQGKFLRPIEPMGEYLKSRGVDWTYHRDNPSLRLLEEQPDHGCDLCSRYRRRAVYRDRPRPGRERDRVRPHRRRFLRIVPAQRAVHRPRQRAAGDHVLAREGFPADSSAGVCDGGHHQHVSRNRWARRSCRAAVRSEPARCASRYASLFSEIEKDYPHLKETLLSAMGNLEPSRLLDPRYLDLGGTSEPELLPILHD